MTVADANCNADLRLIPATVFERKKIFDYLNACLKSVAVERRLVLTAVSAAKIFFKEK